MRIDNAAIFLALIASPIAFAAVSSANEMPVQSGVYDELLVGYDPDSRVVSGYFNGQTGGGQFTCIFYFQGKWEGSLVKIESFFPETPQEKILGQLISSHPGEISLSLQQEPGGCWNASPQHFADQKEPAEFTLARAYPWRAVRVVKGKKAYLFDTAKSATHRKAYLVQEDAVGVRSLSDGWLQIDYTAGNRPVSAWMQESAFYPGPYSKNWNSK
jgi:hypothetical protein